MDQLRGKVAVVTGGARGIGKALAERFLAEQMRVVIGDIDPTSLAATVEELSGAGEICGLRTDVTSQSDVDALRDAALDAFGAVHVVCNNAGVSGRRHAMWETTEADWDWVVGVNLTGVVHGVRSFAPLLVDQGEGHVVNTASLAGLSAVPFAAPYIATKHAVFGLSQTLALEFEASGGDVGVTVLCPDWLKTDIAESHTNWPTDQLGPRPQDSTNPAVQFVDQVFIDSVENAPGPEGLATMTVQAIVANRFLVVTETSLVEQALESRVQLLHGAPPAMPI
jgi:NAD(P)-dependent dehydrogenase (short-subunit alcohol dehydrogenase family)